MAYVAVEQLPSNFNGYYTVFSGYHVHNNTKVPIFKVSTNNPSKYAILNILEAKQLINQLQSKSSDYTYKIIY